MSVDEAAEQHDGIDRDGEGREREDDGDGGELQHRRHGRHEPGVRLAGDGDVVRLGQSQRVCAQNAMSVSARRIIASVAALPRS